MNTHIKTWLGTIIIIIMAITAGMFVWKVYEMNNVSVSVPQKTIKIPEPKVKENNVGIANPASVFCEENGGKLEIITANDGSQIGMCKFSDGSECEEWVFQRGECKMGDSRKQIDISDWKTYRNEKYGFEFKYPKEWKIPLIRENPDGDDLSTWKYYAYINLGCPEVKKGGAGQCPLDMIIYPVSKPESFLFEDYVPAKDQDSSKRSEILYSQINSINTASFTDFEGYYGDSKKVVFFGDKQYLVFMDYMFNYQENGIFSKIISTFKFTN